MTGFILAAGFGTRLQPLTHAIPKALVPVCGAPLLSRILTFLEDAGISRIGVNAHHHYDKMEAYRRNSTGAFSLFHETGSIRGTGGALWFAREFLSGDDMVLVCNVDIVARYDVAEVERRFREQHCDCALLVRPVKGDGTIVYEPHTHAFLGIKTNNGHGGGVKQGEFIGSALYRTTVFSELSDNDFSIIPVWHRLREKGYCVRVIELPDVYWRDTGTPRGLAEVYFDVLRGVWYCDIPPHLVLDTRIHQVFPVHCPDSLREKTGPFTWLESADIPPVSFIEHCIVLADAVGWPDCDSSFSHGIFTPWGSLSFHE